MDLIVFLGVIFGKSSVVHEFSDLFPVLLWIKY